MFHSNRKAIVYLRKRHFLILVVHGYQKPQRCHYRQCDQARCCKRGLSWILSYSKGLFLVGVRQAPWKASAGGKGLTWAACPCWRNITGWGCAAAWRNGSLAGCKRLLERCQRGLALWRLKVSGTRRMLPLVLACSLAMMVFLAGFSGNS